MRKKFRVSGNGISTHWVEKDATVQLPEKTAYGLHRDGIADAGDAHAAEVFERMDTEISPDAVAPGFPWPDGRMPPPSTALKNVPGNEPANLVAGQTEPAMEISRRDIVNRKS